MNDFVLSDKSWIVWTILTYDRCNLNYRWNWTWTDETELELDNIAATSQTWFSSK